jgi:signal transduction histidine kinase
MEKEKAKSPSGASYRGMVLLVLALLFLLFGILAGKRYHDEGYTHRDARKFEKVLHRKEGRLKKEFQELEQLFTQDDPMEVLDRKSAKYQNLSTSEGISIFFYDQGVLRYWSDHSVPVTNRWRPRFNLPFTSLRNADYVTVIQQLNGGMLVGMIEIKTHFPFQNNVLINGFQHDFKLDEGVVINILEAEGTEPIYNEEGAYLFSLDFSESDLVHKGFKAIAVSSLLLFIVLLFAAFCEILNRASQRGRFVWIGIISIVVLGMAFVVLKFSFPALLTGSDLFQPEVLASRYFPSLGAMIVFSISALALAALYYLYGNFELVLSRGKKRATAILLFVASALLLLFIDQLISVLILDSSISFEAHRVTTFSRYTVAGLFVIIIWFVILGLVLDKAIVLGSESTEHVWLSGSIAMSVVMAGALVLPGDYGSWISWVAMLLLLGANLYLRFHRTDRISFSRYIFLLLFISVFMTLRLQQNNLIRIERQREVELVKLSSEHDPVAEMLFEEMSMAIRNDSVFAQYMNRPYIATEQVRERLQRMYLSGYWTKYDLRVTVCRPVDSLYLEPPVDELYHCYEFFEEMILESGIEIPDSDFYFLDNLNGKISYLGSIPYFRAESEHRVIIELDSKILSEELGYPELLLDDDFRSFTKAGFSFAKYHGGQLITQDGDFPYRRTCNFYTSHEEAFERITLDKYDHSIYNVDEQNTIIVGSPIVTLVDTLISFSYIFAFNFLLLALVYLTTTVRIFSSRFNWNFKNRIQYSMVGILFFTFLLICSGTIYFIVQQYRVQHNDNLRNTMRSVYIELIHKVEYEEDLQNWSSESYYNLDELLIKFSNVFYSDINLYDEEGYLLATSRPEIFNRQLLSRRMNRLVFENLSVGNASEFIHNEHIGEMNYISAYVPLLNSENKFLAYLNLPYFTQSGALTRDVTNLVVAVINIYMILMLLILLVSVILADRITQPLRMIQNRIAQVSLSEKNEMIHYDRSDEIRGLVEEYNYMVRELERSAGLLAQSERESAWREMAKQIAHEIKNPLTPMKLNVQHLQRTLEEGKNDPALVNRISATLIEQIDSLSAIANEFSDFAKMPKARNARVNLVSKLKSLRQLFDNTDKASITFDLGGLKRVDVFADKEQLMRVFINLVKNGLQSIPEGRTGEIRISLQEEKDERARITISDNGKGIPEAIRDKLFQPNFTTKSGGMGMGLAISYNIIRSLGGRIWYETILNEGTTFFIELPRSVEKR